VDVKLGDGLAGGYAIVETHVVPSRLVQIVDDRPGPGDELEEPGLFVRGEIPPAACDSVGDDKGMTGVHGEQIPDRETRGVAGDPLSVGNRMEGRQAVHERSVPVRCDWLPGDPVEGYG
jgi:hypothetical protein